MPGGRPLRAASPPPAAGAAAVAIQHTALTLTLDWTARAAHGEAVLTLRARRPLRVVELDGCGLDVTQVRGAKGATLSLTRDGPPDAATLRITLAQPLAAGDTTTVRLAYRTTWINHSDPLALGGSPGRGLRFFRPTGTEPAKREQLWAMGEPDGSACWYPTIDAPDQQFTSALTVRAPAGLTVIATGRSVAVVPEGNGVTRHEWREDTPHAPHQLMLAAGHWIDVPRTVDGLTVHSLGYPDERDAVEATIARLPAMLRFHAAQTGIPFPHATYRQLFVQDVPWGTMGPGLSLLTENMVDDARTHADWLYLWDGLEGEAVAAQWTQLVGLRDWRHAWLHRGLARHLDALFAEATLGRDEALLWNAAGDITTALADWRAGNRHPIVPASRDSAATFAMDNTPSLRAAHVLRHLRSVVGDSSWWRGLRGYLTTARGQLATTADFQRAIETAHGAPLDWFFEQWFYRAGHPVFTVLVRDDRATGQVTLDITQRHAADTSAQALFEGPMAIAVDGVVHRVWLPARAHTVITLPAPTPPRTVVFDHGGVWLKELQMDVAVDALAAQATTDAEPLNRLWAVRELAARARRDSATVTERTQARDALRTVIGADPVWRLRYSALLALQGAVAPRSAGAATVLDAATHAVVLHAATHERSWVRSAALALLGDTRDRTLVPLYRAALRDSSHPVNYTAAIALGQTGSPQAFALLRQLGDVPSWKGENILCALAGFSALGDARAIPFAVAAFADSTRPRWYLATPRWDYRLAAAGTLARLGAADRVWSIVEQRLARAVADDDVNDVFSTALTAASLGHPRAPEVLAAVRARYGARPGAAAALDGFAEQWAALQAPTK